MSFKKGDYLEHKNDAYHYIVKFKRYKKDTHKAMFHADIVKVYYTEDENVTTRDCDNFGSYWFKQVNYMFSPLWVKLEGENK